MKTLIRQFTGLLFAILFLFSCQKSNKFDNPVSPQLPNAPRTFSDEIVEASFSGKITNEEDKPVAQAKVTIGNTTTYTDQYGVFSIEKAKAGKKFGLIRVDADSYFSGFRTVLTSQLTKNFVAIKLRKKLLTGSFDSREFSKVSLQNNVSLEFPENGVVTKQGLAYSGKVNVYGSVIDPATNDFREIMPGELRGVKTNNSVVAMVSFGMISVELEGENGEQLQLAKNKEVLLKMEIPSSLVESAPNEIPMWHFDENSGAWIEEGMGSKNGTMYSGKVSHFSTWNFDVPQNFVELTLQVKKEKLGSVPYKKIIVSDASNDQQRNMALTDVDGRVKMWVPKGISLKVAIAGACDEIFDSMIIGPFQQDADLGEIVVKNWSSDINVTGILLNCASEPIENGAMTLIFEGLTYSTVTDKDGAFNIQLDKCNFEEEVTGSIKGVNLLENKVTEARSFQVRPGENNVGQLMACTDSDSIQSDLEFLKLRVGDQNFLYLAPDDSIFMNRWDTITLVGAFNKFDQTNGEYHQVFNLNLLDTAAGLSTFPPYKFVTGVDSVSYNYGFTFDHDGKKFRMLLEDSVTQNILAYPAVGGFIHVKFNTTAVLHAGTGERLPVEGEIRVKRKE